MRAEQTDGRQLITWSSVDWTATEAVVGRIQNRIFRAAKAGDGARVKNLQKLLVRSREEFRAPAGVRKSPRKEPAGHRSMAMEISICC